MRGKGLKTFIGKIGRDEFGINRIYVKLKNIPKDMLKELKTKINFKCSDCETNVAELSINMQDFIDTERSKDRRETNTSMYFDCGNCAVGG